MKISIKKINIDNPPADASSIRYILVEVLIKELDE
ncbi:MAG: DUF4377 domain-containing protein [Algibacter sp.]|nr:DUF4377 domain-containing protein [Algibacter sp.]MDG1730923.1 DUF4377 domain-containing protein [Algibacter sp.]MDG2179056.1 DUF4377 domain-containing protein [Algibacter sp.]